VIDKTQHPQEWQEWIERRMEQHIGTAGSEAWKQAMGVADRLAFQQPLADAGWTGHLSKPDQKKIDDMGIWEYIVSTPEFLANELATAKNRSPIRYLFPFVPTPYNVFREGFRKSVLPIPGSPIPLPLQAIPLIAKLVDGLVGMKKGNKFTDTFDRAEAAKDLADITIALALTWLLWGLVEGDDDDDEKPALITANRAYGATTAAERDRIQRMRGAELSLRVGENVFPMKRFDPLSTAMSNMAAAVWSMKTMENGQGASAAFNAYFRNVLSMVQDQPFLSGLKSITDATSQYDSAEDKLFAIGDGIVSHITEGAVPNLFRQVMRNKDLYARKNRTADSPTLRGMFPGETTAQPKISGGQSVKKSAPTWSRILFPSATERQNWKVDKVMENWQRQNPLEKMEIDVPGRTTWTYKRKGETVEMTGYEKTLFDAYAQQLYFNATEKSLKDWEVKKPTDSTMARIKNIRSGIAKIARARMFGTGKFVKPPDLKMPEGVNPPLP
jgi:hypothetical protein